jgi:serine/threonine protein kinase
MIAKCHPFFEPKSSDPYYKHLYKETSVDNFWDLHSRKREKDFFKKDFRQLIYGMLQPVPEKRWNLEQVKKSDWFCAPNATAEALKTEFETRKNIITTELEKLRRERKRDSDSPNSNTITGIKPGCGPQMNVYGPVHQVNDATMVVQSGQAVSKIPFGKVAVGHQLTELKPEHRNSEHQRVHYKHSITEKRWITPLSEFYISLSVEKTFAFLNGIREKWFQTSKASSKHYKIRGTFVKENRTCKVNITVSQVHQEDCIIEVNKIMGSMEALSDFVEEFLQPNLAELIKKSEKQETGTGATKQMLSLLIRQSTTKFTTNVDHEKFVKETSL